MADTAASASRNPALLMMYTRPELSIGAVFIDPDVDITGKSLPAPVWMRKHRANRLGAEPALCSPD